MPADNHCRFCSPETICKSVLQPEMVVESIGAVDSPVVFAFMGRCSRTGCENICRKEQKWQNGTAELDSSC